MVNITYFVPRCAHHLNATKDTILTGEHFYNASNLYGYAVEDCLLGRDVICHLDQSATTMCRLSIRMFAAITLAGCLVVKAVYMITINVRARGKIKTNCLTFGDVVVASTLDNDLQIRNECLVNASEGNRYLVDHTCHKHCIDPKSSITGDSIG